MSASASVLLGVGLGVAGVIVAVVAWGRTRHVEVPRSGHWTAPPTLQASSGVDRAALTRAVVWWGERGHRIVVLPPGSPPLGSGIEVRLDRTLPEGTLGVTRCWATPGGLTLTRAEVRLAPSADALVMAHEIGHALGYQHPVAAPSGHILHPTRPGWDGRGAEGP